MNVSHRDLRQFICDIVNLFEGHTHTGCDDGTPKAAEYGGYCMTEEDRLHQRLQSMGIVPDRSGMSLNTWIRYEDSKVCPICRSDRISFNHEHNPDILCFRCSDEGRPLKAWSSGDVTFHKRLRAALREERGF